MSRQPPSGAKVALAALLVGDANLLLLDEPTNHLDIEAREALEGTLAQYPGAILFVSHDRRFVEALAGDRIDLPGQGWHRGLLSSKMSGKAVV